MSSTGFAAILFYCICVVALSSMDVVGLAFPAVPEVTPKPAVPEVTPKYAGPEVTSKSAVPEVTPKYAVPEVTPKPAVPEETPKSVVPKETPKPAAAEETPKFISMGALECSSNITKTVSSRKLIAVEGNGVCPVRFDHTRGISAVAGSCKDRPFPSAERCCGALKHYACPYSELINDNANNGCANDMFYVIMVRGRLRPGLFSQLCVEGPLGLQC